MKKFFILIALLGISVFEVQCMEENIFQETLKNPRAMKKIKSHNDPEVPVVSNEVTKALVCSFCEKSFLVENGLTAHQTFSYCAKKLQEKKNS